MNISLWPRHTKEIQLLVVYGPAKATKMFWCGGGQRVGKVACL